MRCDVAIVGAGIAGSALATILAREGVDVVVLERQPEYADRVRGENLHPWGVAEAQRLDLYDTLIDAGANLVESVVDHGDGPDLQRAEARRVPLSQLLDGVPGEVNMPHAAACRALAGAAVSAGAAMVRPVRHVEVTAGGTSPTVSYRVDGRPGEVACRLVVGADGRSSRVRHQAGIALDGAPAPHMVAGLLVDDLETDPRRNVVGIGEDAWMVTFPQGGGRARVYLCWDPDDPQRFAGPDATGRFLRVAAECVPDGGAWSQATPAGPCRTYPADDTWTDRPFTRGVVLIGDAAGYNNPLIGQGLSLALRDARALAGQLLSDDTWNGPAFTRYGTERAERLRRARFLAQLHARLWTTFGPEGRALRTSTHERQHDDPSLHAATLGIFVGPDRLDPSVCTPEYRSRLLGEHRNDGPRRTSSPPRPTGTSAPTAHEQSQTSNLG